MTVCLTNLLDPPILEQRMLTLKDGTTIVATLQKLLYLQKWWLPCKIVYYYVLKPSLLETANDEIL